VGKAKKVNYNSVPSGAVVLIAGPEDFLASRVIRAIKDAKRAANPMLEVTELDASDYAPADIFSLTEPSLFNDPRLLVISNVERCTDALIEDGIAYLNQISPDSTVVLYHSTGVRGKKLLDALRSSDAVTEVAVERLAKDQERIAFATAEFAASGRKVTNGAIRDLCQAFTDDLAELAAACNQLMQDVAETIDEKTVERYYAGRVQTTSYTVIDAALAGQAGEALKLFRHAVSGGLDVVPMVAAVGAKMRLMARVYENRSATIAQLGGQAWMIDKARRQVSGWTEDGLATVIQEIAICDAAAKGAERDPEFAMERLLLLISRKGLKVA